MGESRVREELPTCREVVELVTDYLEGHMAPGDRERFEMHLAICDACVTYLDQLRLTIRATGSLDESQIPAAQRTELIAAFREILSWSAYRFLRPGGVDSLTGGIWRPGQWVEPPGGFVAYTVADLPHWAADELWTVELDGDIIEREHSLVATRGRIVERVDTWSEAAAAAFAEACRARHDELGSSPSASTAAYMAAHAAGVLAEEAGGRYRAGHDAERAWQSSWLSDRLGPIGSRS